jgi:hypothetical protein
LAILVKAIFSDALGADYKDIFVVEEKEEDLGQATFSAEVIALSRLWV